MAATGSILIFVGIIKSRDPTPPPPGASSPHILSSRFPCQAILADLPVKWNLFFMLFPPSLVGHFCLIAVVFCLFVLSSFSQQLFARRAGCLSQ